MSDHREAYAERLFYALQMDPVSWRSWDSLSQREKGLFRVIVSALVPPDHVIVARERVRDDDE